MNKEPVQSILDIYNRTQFMVRDEGGEDVNFTVGDKKYPKVVLQKQFAIITAWNPMNSELTIEENRNRNTELEKAIKEQNYYYYPSQGSLGDHSEESFTVEDIPMVDAEALGSEFEQYAVLFCDTEGPRFIFLSYK